MSEDHWIDLTTIGSAYEEQINDRTGALRHRRLAEPPMQEGRIRYVPKGDWVSGPAPKD